MSRLPPLLRETMSDSQIELYDRIAGKRGAVRGPFNVWLYSPELCDKVEALGRFVRFECSVPEALRQLAVLVVARHWDAQYMWTSYAKRAAELGIPAEIIAAIAERRAPHFAAPQEKAVYDYARELLESHRVSDATYRAAVALLEPKGAVDLTALIGNYSMVAMVLNAFEIDLPAGVAPPLPT